MTIIGKSVGRKITKQHNVILIRGIAEKCGLPNVSLFGEPRPILKLRRLTRLQNQTT
jgi:hypothetical protein